jgi:hypothetical protein
MALAGELARAGHASSAEAAFWLGLLAIAGPTAGGLASAGASRGQRITLIAGLGIAAYLTKVMIWPVEFTFHDEFTHWRTAADIIATHHLFSPNPLEPTSSIYPGMEIMTAAVAQLTGLSVFVSGLILVGVARLVLMLALYLVFERVSGSPRAAGLASMLYAGNPNFLFFDAQFGYESIAIPLGVFLVYLVLRTRVTNWRAALSGAAALVLVAGSLAMTHHLTSWLFGGALVGALVINLAVRQRHRLPLRGLLVAAIVAAATVGLWFAYVGVGAVTYVGPVLTVGSGKLVQLIVGQAVTRTLFTSAGEVNPLWEQVLAFADVVVLLLPLPSALYLIWRRHRDSPNLILLALIAMVYPASLVLRLTSSTVETSARLSEFLFIGLAPVLALLAVRLLTDAPSTRSRRLRQWGCGAALVIVMGGGAIIAWARWSRLPGPYLVAADARSIEPQGVGAATWARAHLGTHNSIATDRTNALEMGSPLGDQDPVNLGPPVNDLILSTTLTRPDLQTISRAHLRYLVIDNRLSRSLPLTGTYVDPPDWTSTQPVSPLAAQKFATASEFSRVFDSGNIAIYSVSRQLVP